MSKKNEKLNEPYKSDIVSESNSKKEENKGLYFDFMTRISETSGIFNYNDIKKNPEKINHINTFISCKKMWIIREPNDNVKGVDQQTKTTGNELLFFIRRNKDGFTLYTNNFKCNLEPNLKNIEEINHNFWYVINSVKSSSNANIHNDDYYLKEGDIIKIGNIKLIVKEIFIQNAKQEEKKEEIFEVKCVDYKICEICGEKMFHFCKCERNHFEHLDCIKKWVNDHKIKPFENKNKTVTNYVFEIYRCKEEILDKYTKIPKVFYNDIYPLRFKYLNESDKEVDEKVVEFEKPENSSYMILESLEYSDVRNSPDKIMKSFHVIKLIEENKITIGNDKGNDIYLKNSSVSKNHAVIIYKDGKLLIKNKSIKSGTLVMIRENEIKINNEKEIYLQVNNTFFKVKMMEKENFKGNEYTKYPITQVDDANNTNSSSQNSQIPNKDYVEKLNQEFENPELSKGSKFYDI